MGYYLFWKKYWACVSMAKSVTELVKLAEKAAEEGDAAFVEVCRSLIERAMTRDVPWIPRDFSGSETELAERLEQVLQLAYRKAFPLKLEQARELTYERPVAVIAGIEACLRTTLYYAEKAGFTLGNGVKVDEEEFRLRCLRILLDAYKKAAYQELKEAKKYAAAKDYEMAEIYGNRSKEFALKSDMDPGAIEFLESELQNLFTGSQPS